MGTRSIVKIEGINFAKVYIHWDGYPEHMLPWLTEFNATFKASRGDGPQYKFAQLLRFSAKNETKFNLDSSDFTGYGVVPFTYEEDAFVDYVYTLKIDGSVTYK